MGCGRFCQNLFSLFYGDFLFLSESDYSVPYFQTADKLENSLKAIPNIKHSFCQAELQDLISFWSVIFLVSLYSPHLQST